MDAERRPCRARSAKSRSAGACRPGCRRGSAAASTLPAVHVGDQLAAATRAGRPGSASTGVGVDDRRADVAERVVDARAPARAPRAAVVAGDDEAACRDAPAGPCATGVDPRRACSGARPALLPATPEPRARAPARTPRPRPAAAAAGGRRCAPVSDGVLSTTYSRFIVGVSAATRRAAANSRDVAHAAPGRRPGSRRRARAIDVGLVEVVARLDRLAERQHARRRARCRAPAGSYWCQLRLRVARRAAPASCARERRRGDGLGQDAQAGAPHRASAPSSAGASAARNVAPGADLAAGA